LNELKQNDITHVVNCTNGYGEIPNYHEGKIQYYRFPISDFTQFVKMNDDGTSLHNFVDPLFAFIDSAINSGKNVMVHCLAGAHRAGTTSCACLIYYEKLDVQAAVSTAKSRRPIIDPICNFPLFLKRLHQVKIAKTP
jgi:protein-tyrosine phosphatase